jgi:hypothetical protein
MQKLFYTPYGKFSQSAIEGSSLWFPDAALTISCYNNVLLCSFPKLWFSFALEGT